MAPWQEEYGRGQGLNARSMAQLLKPYGLRPRTVRATGLANDERTAKGYRRADLEPVWERYLSDQAVTAEDDSAADDANALSSLGEGGVNVTPSQWGPSP